MSRTSPWNGHRRREPIQRAHSNEPSASDEHTSVRGRVPLSPVRARCPALENAALCMCAGSEASVYDREKPLQIGVIAVLKTVRRVKRPVGTNPHSRR